ncbi:MAG TPA: hypothetical protein VGJ29_05985 [Vicinamibacterales bacterium]
MDARERWQALQTNLNVARASVEAGDRARALEAVNAALAIDPEFLAAQSLRDRILTWTDLLIAAPSPLPAPIAAPARQESTARRPLVSAEGYARFEERAKRRRVDKRIEAARLAIERGKLREAAAALDEVIELDPNLPELASLTAAFDELRRSTVPSDRGPWIAAAVVFGTIVLAASWIQESRVLQSRAVTAVAPLVATNTPEPIVVEPIQPDVDAVQPLATSDEQLTDERPALENQEPVARPIATTATHEPAPPPLPPTQPVRPAQLVALPPTQQPPAPAASSPIQDITAPIPVPRAAPPVARNTAEPAPTAPLPAVVPATPVVPSNPDELQVKQVLQRYRVAYEGLDAQSAQAVWPAVNQVALARAFDGLESQRLIFDACNVELQGSHALATCRGTARYVPKIGSRQPRVEPRIWSFALRKIGAEWKIDNARAER